MSDEPEDPWAYGVTADDAENPRTARVDDTLEDDGIEPGQEFRHHTGRFTSPSLGAYDPAAANEALTKPGDDDEYFRQFGYGEGFGDGRLGDGYEAGGDTGSSYPPISPPTRTESPISPATQTESPISPATRTESPISSDERSEPPRPPEYREPTAPDPGDGTAGSAAPTWSAGGPVPPPQRAGRPADPIDPADPSLPGATATGPVGGTDPFAGTGTFRPAGAFSGERGSIDDVDDLDDLDDMDEAELDNAAAARRNLIEWGVVLVGAVLLALVLRAFVLQAFWIPSPSMETTLLVRDRVLVNKVSYRIGDIDRGDVIVFRRTDEEIERSPELPRDVIKRVIALGGEEIEIIDNEVFIDGLLLQEPYLDVGVTTSDFGPSIVPEGHVFVMGDNRELSLDSRFETGPIPEDRVVGRAFFLFWPLNRLGSL